MAMDTEQIRRDVEGLRATLSQGVAQANELHEGLMDILSSTDVLASLGKRGISRRSIVELAKELDEVIIDLRVAKNKYFILGGSVALLLKAVEEQHAATRGKEGA